MFCIPDNKSDIEDLLQDIYINIWNSLDKFKGEAKISTWIYRIAVNTALLHNKQLQKDRKVIANYLQEKTNEDDDYTEIEENIVLLKKSINQLMEQDRILISLLLEGLKYDDIADILGITLNNVGVKINRAKKRLTKIMEDFQYERV